MTTTLTCLIRQYREAQQEMIAAMDADADTFNAALAKCKALRAQIEAMAQQEHTVDLFDWR